MRQARGGSSRGIRCKDHPSNKIDECHCQWVEARGKDNSRADEHIAVKLFDILQSRRRFFNDGIFSDPAWIILLKLFIAEKAHASVRLAEVCAIADIPAPAASRWMKILVQNGYVTFEGDDREAVFRLTPEARGTLAALFAEYEDHRA